MSPSPQTSSIVCSPQRRKLASLSVRTRRELTKAVQITSYPYVPHEISFHAHLRWSAWSWAWNWPFFRAGSEVYYTWLHTRSNDQPRNSRPQYIRNQSVLLTPLRACSSTSTWVLSRQAQNRLIAPYARPLHNLRPKILYNSLHAFSVYVSLCSSTPMSWRTLRISLLYECRTQQLATWHLFLADTFFFILYRHGYPLAKLWCILTFIQASFLVEMGQTDCIEADLIRE